MASKEWGKLYTGPEWAARRAQVIYRQNGICEDSPDEAHAANSGHHALYLGKHPCDTPQEFCHALCWPHHVQREHQEKLLLLIFNELLPESRNALFDTLWPMLARSMGIRHALHRFSPSVWQFWEWYADQSAFPSLEPIDLAGAVWRRK